MVRYKTVLIDEVSVFYREAGDPSKPLLVLLGGFPSTSHYFRDLITALEDRFHLIAPDYPGFGDTTLPDPAGFDYTFDHLSTITEQFLAAVGATRFGLYMHDYGGPIGNRIIARHPDWLEWLVIQNANTYEEGFTGAWDGLRDALWIDRSPETEAPVRAFSEPDGIKEIYLTGARDPERISPDAWHLDAHFMERPHARRIHLDLLHDYQHNVPLYPQWQAFLRAQQPPTLITWGTGDLFFTPEGGQAYLRDLPDAELHLLDTGHFALEDHAAEIAALITRFHADKVAPTSL